VTHDLGSLEAVGAGLLQGVALVFPISGLGHGVLVGSIGGDAGSDLAPMSSGPLYPVLRVAVGIALAVYFWRDWARIARGILTSIGRVRVTTPEQRWGWLVVLASVPGCIAVALLVPRARSLQEHPLLAAGCMAGSGVFMIAVWWWWRRSPRAGGMSGTHRARVTRSEDASSFAGELSVLRVHRAVFLGLLPVASLVPGVSGMALMLAAALAWGLTHEQAARAALIIMTPSLITWGLRDLPMLRSGSFDELHGNLWLAAIVAVAAAYLATALLVRYFKSASLRPFGYYCLLAGGAAVAWLST
jgi:undecaprenyl-diphosphatase